MGRSEDAVAFESWRSLLFGIAYRMLGSATDAEDMVQEAAVRWLQRPEGSVESLRAYLTTIVTRLCIDHLSSARVQRVAYTGPWLPEPIVMEDDDAAVRADSLSLAFLALLEELTGPERAAYLLHDVFGYRFDEVGQALGRTPAGCRQLASRARRHIGDRRQRFDADLRHGQEMTRRFVTACATGDLDGLLRLLADDVTVWTDGGGVVRAAVRRARCCSSGRRLPAQLALLAQCGEASPGRASRDRSERAAGHGPHGRPGCDGGSGTRHPGEPHRRRPSGDQPGKLERLTRRLLDVSTADHRTT